MNERTDEPIREIDLFAYADGLLADDPGRLAAVEAFLVEHPSAAAMVDEIRAQNEEIRDLYGREIARGVPERLRRAVHGGTPQRFRRLRRLAAVVPLLVAAGGGGWLVGSHWSDGRDVPAQFLTSAATYHRNLASAPALHAAAEPRAVETQSLWSDDRLWLEVRAPDLSSAGYELVERERVGPESSRTVRLLYRDADGASLNLFVRPRWGREDAEVTRENAGGVTVHYWPAGPLAFALTTEDRGAGADRLAEMIRQSVEDAQLLEEPPLTAFGNGDGGSPLEPGELPAADPLSPTNARTPPSQYN